MSLATVSSQNGPPPAFDNIITIVTHHPTYIIYHGHCYTSCESLNSGTIISSVGPLRGMYDGHYKQMFYH